MTIHNKGKVFGLVYDKHILDVTDDVVVVKSWIDKYNLSNKLKRNKWFQTEFAV